MATHCIGRCGPREHDFCLDGIQAGSLGERRSMFVISSSKTMNHTKVTALSLRPQRNAQRNYGPD